MRPALILTLLTLAGFAWYSFESRQQPFVPVPIAQTLAAGREALGAQVFATADANPTYGPIRDTTVPDPQLDASSALLVDADSGRTFYERNAVIQAPIASLTKLMSALVVNNIFQPDDIITVASSSIRVDGIKQTLYTGEQLRVSDLVSMMLIESSNDAAYALADAARHENIDFVGRMNATATALGMDHCHFMDPAGLDDTAYCTARDLVRLVHALQQNLPQIWLTLRTQELHLSSVDGRFTHDVKSTDALLSQIPGIIGGKTGNTDGALGCMVLVVQGPAGHDTLVSVILGSRTRFTDTKTLINWVGQAYHFQ